MQTTEQTTELKKVKRVYKKKEVVVTPVEVNPLETMSDMLTALPEVTEKEKKIRKRVIRKKSESPAITTEIVEHNPVAKLTGVYDGEDKGDEEEPMPCKKKTRLPDFPEEGPLLHPYGKINAEIFDRLFKSFFIKNHRYTVLRQCEGGDIHPTFFTVIDGLWEPNLLVQFVRHETHIDEQGCYHVNPLWDNLWSIGYVDETTMYNCIPFDEERKYCYTEDKI